MPGLHSKFQANLEYILRPSLKRKEIADIGVFRMYPLSSSLVMDMLGLVFSCGHFTLKGHYDGKNETSSRVPGISVPNTGSKWTCERPNSCKVSTKELSGPIKQIQIQLLLSTL